MSLSFRAQLLTARTYNRPKNTEATVFETWDETITRVIGHQQWLWERAAGRKLKDNEKEELQHLKRLLLDRKVMLAGRTLWLGGTEVAKDREVSQFNCSFLEIRSVHDFVDLFWLLLNGCGVGFSPVSGGLNGFSNKIKEVKVVRSERKDKGGKEENEETWDPQTKTWTIKVGDSGEAWAKSVGKLLAGKYPADCLVLDFSEIRPEGSRLDRYGWICSGDSVIAPGYVEIAGILNRRAGQLLTKLDILDIANWLGVIQTGRRGAEICLVRYGDSEWYEIATAKKDFWKTGNEQRAQSNNSILFYEKPSLKELKDILYTSLDCGGSEPGFYNAQTALKRAPWFKGTNPCGEILLGDRSFCNLVEVDLGKFYDDPDELRRAIYLVARANYRQTCVNLDDGILQRAWHENNEYLRLCGVGLCGIAKRQDLGPHDYKTLKNWAVTASYGMADELGLPRPKNTTTIKPGGTTPKIMDTTEGCKKPDGKYIFNNVTFNASDPLLEHLSRAGYRIFSNPLQKDAVLVTLPVSYEGIDFRKVGDLEINADSAIDQLETYRMLMENYVEQNCSITVTYEPGEIPDISRWIDRHWDSYVGVSFLLKQDPTRSAEELGYPYLPQEVVSENKFREYESGLKDVNLENVTSSELEVDAGDCGGGMCPVR